MKARNKWNGKTYEVNEITDRTVTLVRDEDGYTFTILKSEYYFSYTEKAVDKVKQV